MQLNLTDKEKLIIKTEHMKDLERELSKKIIELEQRDPEKIVTDIITKNGALSAKCVIKSFKTFIDNIRKELPRMEKTLEQQGINETKTRIIANEFTMLHHLDDEVISMYKEVSTKYDTFVPKKDPECVNNMISDPEEFSKYLDTLKN